ncbi:hypothetical protein [Aliivibrio kagoshimensis]|uniref:hypothetical protein n=1 Tax=Aliivibrio kagoshimensis TaxID=2910230 RepID=UPI003D0C0451
MNKKVLLAVAMFCMPSVSYAGTNVAIAEFVNSIRGSFNMLVAHKEIVSAKTLRKTNKMIEKGYRSEVLNMQLLLESSGLDANVRMLSAKRFPEFSLQENLVKTELTNMVKTISKESKRRLESSVLTADVVPSEEGSDDESGDIADDIDLSDDIGSDIDFDDSIVDVSSDVVANEVGAMISLDQVALDTFITIVTEYSYRKPFRGQEVLWYAGGNEGNIVLGRGNPNLKQAFLPFHHDQFVKPMPLHAIFATTFMPNRQGVLHVMEMYIILVVNESEHGTVRVAQRKINKFRWDRNPYYISAATGTVLRKIFTSTLGKKVEMF